MLNWNLHSKKIVGLLLALCMFAVLANAQEYRGKISGLVTDPSQATVSDAAVTLTNANTGVTNNTKTDSQGHYQFDFVLPGTYAVTVSAPGFAEFKQENVLVQTRADITVDVILHVTGVVESLNVTTEVTSVEFNTSTMSTTVQGEMLKDLPVQARNPFTLALLDPAVVNQYWDVAHRNPFYMWSNGGLDIGGPTGGKNDQELDGVTLNISARGSYTPIMDNTLEVTVQQNSVDSEFGFSAGGTIQIATKSGANNYHGDAFYLGKNPALNALSNRITRDKNVERQNDWGGTLSNQIIKNKLFSFFAYEQLKVTQPSNVTDTVPTDLQRAGDFSQTYQADGTLRVIYDPTTTVYDPTTKTATRQPFAGNKIPTTRINPTGQNVVSNLWKPNGPGDDASGINNFRKTYSWWMNYWNLSERLDYNLSDKWRVFGRFSKYQTRLDNPNWGGTISVPSDNGGIMDALNGVADVLYTVSPTTTIDARLGVTYLEDDYASEWAKVDTKVWSDIWPNSTWYNSVLNSAQGIYYPRFNFQRNDATATYTGTGGWWLVHGRSYNPTVSLTHVAGKHHLKAGWQLRYSYDQDNAGAGPGYFNISSIDTGRSYIDYNASQSGDMFASALLGVVNNARAQINPNLDVHQQQWGFYVQDDIKLTRNLTLNLGLRWERETAPADELARLVKTLDLKQELSNLTYTMPSQVNDLAAKYGIKFSNTGGLVYTTDSNKRMYDAPWNTFLPRAGLAYRLNDKTAIRGGYARYATPWVMLHPETGGLQTYGFSNSTDTLPSILGVPVSYIDNPYPSNNQVQPVVGKSLGAYTRVGSNVSYWDGNIMKTGMNDRFNLTVQHQVHKDLFTEATFFMSFAHNIQTNSMWGGTTNRNLNQLNPAMDYAEAGNLENTQVTNPFYGLPSSVMPGTLRNQPTVSLDTLLKTYPQYGEVNVMGWPGRNDHYYALQVKIERPMATGLAYTVGYSYNHENYGDYFNSVDQYANKFTMMDRGTPRHNLRAAGTWQVPIGRGRQFLGHINRVADAAIGGWALASTLTWQSGALLTFGDALVTGDPTQNVPNGYYFNPAAFQVLPSYTERTNPHYYSNLRGRNFWQIDTDLSKNFKINERFTFELKLDAYNVLNKFIPSNPDTEIGSSTMGLSTGVYGGNYGRTAMFTGKLHF